MNGLDKMKIRIAAAQDLEEMEARMKEDEIAKRLAAEENDRGRWSSIKEWAKDQTRRHTDAGGWGSSDGETKTNVGRKTWNM